MSRILNGAKAFYGAHPLQLVLLLGCFAVAGFAVSHVLGDPLAIGMLIWFVGAVIGHDLVLFPVYAVADLSLAQLSRLPRPRRVSPVNYVRTPALGAALTFALFFPGIIEQGSTTYTAATGQTQAPFLVRWLILVAVLFATSALVYAIRVLLAHRAARSAAQAVLAMVGPGEQVLDVAGPAPDAVASTAGLYHRDARRNWVRIPWSELETAHWDGQRLQLRSAAGQLCLELSDPGTLPETVQHSIAARQRS